MNTNHQNRTRWPLAAAALALLAMTAVSSAQSDSTLSNLVPSAGTLTPGFTSANGIYTTTVPYATTSITVTPTKAEAGGTITIAYNAGSPVAIASTVASDPISLSVGSANVIALVVTSADTTTTKTYTLTVTRATPVVDLSSLVPSAGTLAPAFASGTTSYTAGVPYATTSITVTPTAPNASATITVNGIPVTSGSPSGTINLNVGTNTITTVVTGEDAITTKTYTLVVRRGVIIVREAKGFANVTTKDKLATSHLGSTLLSYDATGVEKLVVAIALEGGFNGVTSNVTGVTFNGVAMTQAVEENTKGGPGDGGSAEIWYLDNPFQGSATFGFSSTSSGGGINGAIASVIGLAGAAPGTPGIGSTSAVWTNVGPATTSITTTANESLVIAMVENSGNNNAAGTPTANSPLTQITNGNYGSQWASFATGYQYVAGVGTTITPTFTTNTGTNYSIHVIAAEFKVPVPTQYWDMNLAAAGAGGPAATGTWDGLATNWNPKTDGTDPVAAWSANSVAVFAAGTDATDPYTVTVDSTQDLSGLTFEEGTVTLANGTSGVLRLTGDSAVNVATGRTATVGVPFSDDGSARKLAKVGAGMLSLVGDLSYTGATNVAQGTLILSGNNAAATGGMTLSGGITQFDSSSAINGTARDVTINTAGVVVFGASFETGTDIPTALANRIVAASTGVIAADNYAGTNFDFNTPGLTAAYFHSVGNVTYTGTLTPGGTTYRLGGGGGTLTMSNTDAIVGAGNSLVVKGNVVLSAANNYDSGTTLTAGTLAVGNDGSLGSGTFTINGGIIQSADSTAHVLANPLFVGSDITVGGAGDLTFSNTLATPLGATRIFTINNPASSFAQAFGGTGFGITKAGAGAMTLSGANTYTGATTVNAGTLTLSGSNNSAGAINLTLGTLKLSGTPNAGLASGLLTFGNGTLGNAVIQAVTADQVITNALTLNQNNGTISGAQSLQVSGTFTNSGANRTLTNNVDTGKSLTLAGQVKLSEHATTGRILTIAGSGATTISGAIVNGATGAGGLTKTGAGTLTLTNNTNAYTGATSVTGGTLAVSGTGSINTSSAITINGATAAFMHNSSVANSRTFTLTSGTLGGAGTISTAITAGANVTLAPGDRTLATPAKGTLTVTNAVSLTAASSKAALRLFGPTSDDSDKLVQSTTGTIAFGGILTVSIDGSWTPVDGTTYDLFDWIGTPTGTFSSISLPLLATGFKWHDYGSGVFFDYATGQIKIDTDNTTPTLIDITEDKSPATVAVGTVVTYTVTFSEDMDAGSVSAADFSNAGTAAYTIGTITETSPGVFTVLVTPTGGGTFQLQVPISAEIKDAASNPLDNDPAIDDDVILNILSPYDAWAGGAAFDADANDDGVANGMAWLLGAADPSANATGLVPVPTHQAGKLIMTFRCLKTANRGGAVLKVQYSNDLGLGDLWTSHQAVVPDVDSTVGTVFFDTSTDANPTFINVRAEIPASGAASGKLFGRLVGEP